MLDWTRMLAGGRVGRSARWENWKHFEGRNDRFAEVGHEEGRGWVVNESQASGLSKWDDGITEAEEGVS